jgi:Tim10/DDP family zinc finger
MSIVRDFLRQKDSDYDKFIPAAYKMSNEDKIRVTTVQNLRTKFEIETAAKCMKPCFRNMTTSVVSENESECMTNCIAKGLETLAQLQLAYNRSI